MCAYSQGVATRGSGWGSKVAPGPPQGWCHERGVQSKGPLTSPEVDPLHLNRPASQPSPSSELLPIADAAQRCGVSVASLRRARKAGRLRGVVRESEHSNARWLVPLASLRAAGYAVAEAGPAVDEASLERAQLVAELRASQDRCAQADSLVLRLERQLASAEARADELARLLGLALEARVSDRYQRGAA